MTTAESLVVDPMQVVGRERVERMISRFGCLPPDAPTGPVIERFHPHALARALELELNKAELYGFTKITLHMDIPDARALAIFLAASKGG